MTERPGRATGRSWTTGLGDPSVQDFIDELPEDIHIDIKGSAYVFDQLKDYLQKANNLSQMDEDVVQGIVHQCVEKNRVRPLLMLQHCNVWNPDHDSHVIELADNADFLLECLKAFQLPLAAYPAMAQAYQEEALEFFHSREVEETDVVCQRSSEGSIRTLARARELRCLPPPTPAACLLANYLLVPSDAGEILLTDILDPMVVFHKRLKERASYAGSHPQNPYGHSKDQPKRESLLPLSETMVFPKSLGAVYLRRLVSMHPSHDSKESTDFSKKTACNSGNWYDCHRQELTLKGLKQPLRTTKKNAFTVNTDSEKTAALIPLRAESYAYVFHGEGLELGGFLYLDKDDKLCAVNSILFEQRRFALCFGDPEQLSRVLDEDIDAKMQVLSVPLMLQAGATHYTWLIKDDTLTEFRAKRPGFAYVFKGDQSKNCFFPLKGSSEVLDRARICHDLNCALLPKAPESDLVKRRLTHYEPSWRLTLGHILNLRPRSANTPVKLARLRIPGILHPVVLHALAFTPSRQVLTTPGAKAIAQVGYENAMPIVTWDIVLEVASIVCVTGLAGCIRSGDSCEASDQKLFFFAICATCFCSLSREICLLTGYHRRAWSWDYFSSKVRLMTLIHLVLQLTIIIWFSVGSMQDIHGAVRAPIAIAGCIEWARLLYMFRGMRSMQLGTMILPIFAALQECVNFVPITLCFLLSSAHAKFALSTKGMEYHEVMYSAFRLGFMQHFEIEGDSNDVVYEPLQGDSEYFEALPYLQYIAFMTFSFLVAVAIMNIFIGVMTNAFDYHHERALESFVRARAAIALDRALMREGLAYVLSGVLACCYCSHCMEESGFEAKEQVDMLWLALPRADDELEVSTSEVSIRGTIASVTSGLRRQLDELSKSIDELKQRSSQSGPMSPNQPTRPSIASVRRYSYRNDASYSKSHSMMSSLNIASSDEPRLSINKTHVTVSLPVGDVVSAASTCPSQPATPIEMTKGDSTAKKRPNRIRRARRGSDSGPPPKGDVEQDGASSGISAANIHGFAHQPQQHEQRQLVDKLRIEESMASVCAQASQSLEEGNRSCRGDETNHRLRASHSPEEDIRSFHGDETNGSAPLAGCGAAVFLGDSGAGSDGGDYNVGAVGEAHCHLGPSGSAGSSEAGATKRKASGLGGFVVSTVMTDEF